MTNGTDNAEKLYEMAMKLAEGDPAAALTHLMLAYLVLARGSGVPLVALQAVTAAMWPRVDEAVREGDKMAARGGRTVGEA